MVNRIEETLYIKEDHAHFQPCHMSQLYVMEKSEASIQTGRVGSPTELDCWDEVVGNDFMLKVFSNGFLQKFAHCLQQRDRPMGFGRRVVRFVGPGDDDYCGRLPASEVIAKSDTGQVHLGQNVGYVGPSFFDEEVADAGLSRR